MTTENEPIVIEDEVEQVQPDVTPEPAKVEADAPIMAQPQGITTQMMLQLRQFALQLASHTYSAMTDEQKLKADVIAIARRNLVFLLSE